MDRAARAPRYRVDADLRYRRRGDRDWCAGRTENVSRSGVLFHGPRLFEEGVAVALRFQLPVEIYGQPAAVVACHGRIVRAVASEAGEPVVLAATITRFRLVRRRED